MVGLWTRVIGMLFSMGPTDQTPNQVEENRHRKTNGGMLEVTHDGNSTSTYDEVA